jgi:hypothetical protein
LSALHLPKSRWTLPRRVGVISSTSESFVYPTKYETNEPTKAINGSRDDSYRSQNIRPRSLVVVAKSPFMGCVISDFTPKFQASLSCVAISRPVVTFAAVLDSVINQSLLRSERINQEAVQNPRGCQYGENAIEAPFGIHCEESKLLRLRLACLSARA